MEKGHDEARRAGDSGYLQVQDAVLVCRFHITSVSQSNNLILIQYQPTHTNKHHPSISLPVYPPLPSPSNPLLKHVHFAIHTPTPSSHTTSPAPLSLCPPAPPISPTPKVPLLKSGTTVTTSP